MSHLVYELPVTWGLSWTHLTLCFPLDCRPLTVPDFGRFLEGDVRDYQRSGTQLTPVCDNEFFKATESVEKLTCQVHGKWTDDKGQEIQSSDWEQTTRFSICESKKPSLSTCLHLCLTNFSCLTAGCERETSSFLKEKLKLKPCVKVTKKQLLRAVPVGSTVAYSCKERNQHVIGNSSRICQNDGSYSSAMPTCKRKWQRLCVPYSVYLSV